MAFVIAFSFAVFVFVLVNCLLGFFFLINNHNDMNQISNLFSTAGLSSF